MGEVEKSGKSWKNGENGKSGRIWKIEKSGERYAGNWEEWAEIWKRFGRDLEEMA